MLAPLSLTHIITLTFLATTVATSPIIQIPATPSHDFRHTDDEGAQVSLTSHGNGVLGSAAGARPSVTLKTRPTVVYRPTSAEDVQQARWASMRDGLSVPVEWTPTTILGPDIEDRHTLSQLARMTGNAYALPGKSNWYDLDPAWNKSFPFGWEDEADGFRGHVFVSPGNDTVVLSIKGTTLQGPTSKKDKFNDNLLFSCCCGHLGFPWSVHAVCGCYAKNWRCDSTCLTKALIEDSLFYSVGVNLVTRVLAMYPTSNIWLTGHSLGGALASLLATTFGLPAVTFESPGEALAASRLHLPMPPARLAPITHVYHNADPIALGTCNGPFSPCAQAGFAMETRAHLGQSIVYDTVGQLGWHVDIRTHPIKVSITRILDLEREWEEGREVPMARKEEDVEDCYKWEFGEFLPPKE